MKHYCFFIFLCLFSLQSVAQGGEAHIKVYGEVAKPLTLYGRDLLKMNRTTADLKDHDGSTHTYAGVAVKEILEMAGATMGDALRGKNLAKYILVKCADGYRVVFALAELDSGFTDRTILLADRVEGKPLPDNRGPFRLVVPGEKRPARSAYQVTELVVGFIAE